MPSVSVFPPSSWASPGPALGVLVFLGSFIPVVGALLTGAIAVLLALVANGLVNALIMLAMVLVVQQIESNILQPLVMGKAVALHPWPLLSWWLPAPCSTASLAPSSPYPSWQWSTPSSGTSPDANGNTTPISVKKNSFTRTNNADARKAIAEKVKERLERIKEAEKADEDALEAINNGAQK